MNTAHLLVVIVGGGAHIRGSRFLDPAETVRRTMRIPMRRRYLVGGIAAAAVLVGGGFAVDAASGGGGGGSPYGSAAPPAMPSAARLGTAALAPGTALVDGSGRSLYLFEKDSPTMSACTGACASVWPPVLAHGSATQASAPVRGALLGSAQRSDGTRQVTYDGHPLYRYAGDDKAGQTHGQGLDQFGAGWYVVSPSGHKIDPVG
jgi:predicted lipoprotein with Yx(FWY)xxD motif